MTKYEIKLTYEMVDSIVLQALEESYELTMADINRLTFEKTFRELKEFERIDLKNFRKQEKFLRKTINYFSLPSEKISKFQG